MDENRHGQPFGPLRRKDREITDPAAIEAILREGTVLSLALAEDNIPFVVPVFYAYDGEALYVHSARAGTKVRILRRNPAVCFVVSLDHGLVPAAAACDFEARHRTVVGHGRARFLEDPAEKALALDRIVARFTAKRFTYPPGQLGAVAVIRIDIAAVTGKAHGLAPDR